MIIQSTKNQTARNRNTLNPSANLSQTSQKATVRIGGRAPLYKFLTKNNLSPFLPCMITASPPKLQPENTQLANKINPRHANSRNPVTTARNGRIPPRETRAASAGGNPEHRGRLRTNRAAEEANGESRGRETTVALSTYPARRPAAKGAAASQEP